MRLCSAIRTATIAAGAWLLFMTPTMAAIQICVSVVGAGQGRIVGDRDVSFCENAPDSSFEAEEFHHLVRHELNGPAVHEPVVFTKDLGPGSIGLWIAHRDREPLTVTLRFYRPASDGRVTLFYLVKLFDARVAAIEPLSGDLREPASAALPDRERVRLSYATMEVEWYAGAQTHQLTNPVAPL